MLKFLGLSEVYELFRSAYWRRAHEQIDHFNDDVIKVALVNADLDLMQLR